MHPFRLPPRNSRNRRSPRVYLTVEARGIIAKKIPTGIEVVMDMNSPPATPGAQVFFPDALRTRVGNRSSVVVAGNTVREIIGALDQDFPGLRFNLCHETGELRPFVNIFVDRENIRYLQGLDTPVSTGATIYILQSVAGG